MSRPNSLACMIVALLFGTAATVSAQFQNQAGGGFGNAGGVGGFGGTSFGNSGFGGGPGGEFGGGFGSSGFGTGGFGSGGFGSGFGNSSFGTGGLGGQAFGQTGIGGTSAQSGQAFVGRDSGDMQQLLNQLGQGSQQFFQQLNRSLGGRGRNRGQQSGQEQNAELPVRVQLNVAFNYPRPQPAVLATKIRRQLDQVLSRGDIPAPEVEVVGDTVILRGTADSESQRLVIEKLVEMEPGVMQVDNRLTVADSEANEPQ